MARARNIKPGTFKNELLGSMEPLAVLLFISLWTLADREGRIEDRPLRIKAETFPYRENIDINSYLTLLERYGFIERYEAKGIKVIRVVKFLDHQNPHGTEKDSELPDKDGFLTVHIRKGNCVTGETKKIPYENQQHKNFNVKATLDNVNSPSLNALIPDSFNLIPSNKRSEPIGSATPSVWDLGESFGISRSLIGKQIKESGEEKVAEALAFISIKSPADPVQYFIGATKKKKRGVIV